MAGVALFDASGSAYQAISYFSSTNTAAVLSHPLAGFRQRRHRAPSARRLPTALAHRRAQGQGAQPALPRWTHRWPAGPRRDERARRPAALQSRADARAAVAAVQGDAAPADARGQSEGREALRSSLHQTRPRARCRPLRIASSSPPHSDSHRFFYSTCCSTPASLHPLTAATQVSACARL